MTTEKFTPKNGLDWILEDNCVKPVEPPATAQYLFKKPLELAHGTGNVQDLMKKPLKLADLRRLTQEFEKNRLMLARKVG